MFGSQFDTGFSGPDRVTVDTSTATITMKLDNRRLRSFVGSANIAAPKTIALQNTTNTVEWQFTFTLSGLHALTFPADFKMSDARWNDATNIWTPLDTGTYVFAFTYDGTYWNAKIINGPFS